MSTPSLHGVAESPKGADSSLRTSEAMLITPRMSRTLRDALLFAMSPGDFSRVQLLTQIATSSQRLMAKVLGKRVQAPWLLPTEVVGAAHGAASGVCLHGLEQAEEDLVDGRGNAVFFAEFNDFPGKHFHLCFPPGLHILHHRSLPCQATWPGEKGRSSGYLFLPDGCVQPWQGQ